MDVFFPPWDLVKIESFHQLVPNNGISVFEIHFACTLVVAVSDKPQTSFQVVGNYLCENGMHKFSEHAGLLNLALSDYDHGAWLRVY